MNRRELIKKGFLGVLAAKILPWPEAKAEDAVGKMAADMRAEGYDPYPLRSIITIEKEDMAVCFHFTNQNIKMWSCRPEHLFVFDIDRGKMLFSGDASGIIIEQWGGEVEYSACVDIKRLTLHSGVFTTNHYPDTFINDLNLGIGAEFRGNAASLNFLNE